MPLMNSLMIKLLCALLLLPLLLPDAFAAGKQSYPENTDWTWFFYEKTLDAETRSVVYRQFYMKTFSHELLFDASLMPLVFTRYRTERN